MDEDLKEALLKRAKGYTYNEVQEEYAVNDDGQIALTKRKVVEKYCPPDSSALKTYLDLCGDDDLHNMTDEQLQEEKHRLLMQLYDEEKLQIQQKNDDEIADAVSLVNNIYNAKTSKRVDISKSKNKNQEIQND